MAEKPTYEELEKKIEHLENVIADLRSQDYRDLVENLNDVVYSVNGDGVIAFMSPPVESVLGYKNDEIAGRQYGEFVHPDDLELLDRSLSDILEGRAHPTEYRVRTKAMGYRWVRTSSKPIFENGDFAGLRGVLTDIDERKKAEMALRESKQRFQKVFDDQMDAIFILNSEFPARVVEANQAATAIFGYRQGEMIGETVDMLHVDESHRKAFQTKLYSAIQKDGHLKDFEFAMKRKSGSVFPSEHSVFELKDDAGARTGWVSIVRDLTERKQIENRLRHAQKMESLGNLAGGIAHDFNNILYPVVGLSELLIEDLPKGSLERENAYEIFKAGKRGGELVRQILAFSRQAEHKTLPVRVQKILKEALKLARASIPSNIEIIDDIDADCGMVIADPVQLHQVAMILITNAYQAVERSGGRISVKLAETRLPDEGGENGRLVPGRYAKLEVADDGCGMTSEILGRIFEPYFTTRQKGKGSGLGLAVAYGIVKEYRGEIKVQSEPGKGSTFCVYLPLIEKKRGGDSAESSGPAETGNERVLLIDDEKAIISMECQMLERLGYRVTCRTNGLDALDAFRISPDSFDLVVTDMAMPGMTGDRLAMELKKIRPDIPVIVCTGFSERIDPEKSQAAGIAKLLAKPVGKSELAAAVRKVIDDENNANAWQEGRRPDGELSAAGDDGGDDET